ncbi:hypothetical protein GCM10020358_82010 [Amorphoplanes nipponensis]|uniref:Uncharacterized protein n=1 Tax=Actinoplanes nipponensis TaxID=135950 RepID=A0A919J9D9_9ACTN|nr:hypothetical protein [Actinoplanes nipponensis]GIE46814.1 hypothetical protein Ani05nite_03480 [Actinoplanes nipponensis]
MSNDDRHDLDLRLRAAATPVAPGRVRQASAQALLERIVATPRTAGSPARPAAPRTRRLRWAAAAAAAVAVTGAALVMPGLGGEDQAYASWTDTPAALPAGDTRELSRECVRQELEPGYGYTQAELGAARNVLGERRGAYRYLSIATARWTATCFRDRAGKVHFGSVMEAPVTDAALGRRGVELQGWGQLRTSEGYARLMSGHLGSDVVAVDVVLHGGRTVHATVKDRYFVAWYPEAVDATGGATLTLKLAGGGTVAGLPARDLMETPKLD